MSGGINFLLKLVYVTVFSIIIIVNTIIAVIILKKTVRKKRIWRVPLLTLAAFFLIIVLDIGIILLYNNYNSICRDQKILSQLKNDETPEFILDGKYYELPCSLQTFIDNGWNSINMQYPTESKIKDDYTIQNGQFAIFEIETPYGYLELVTECTGEKSRCLADTMVVAAFYISHETIEKLDLSPNVNFFVTKSGITETTDYKIAKVLSAKLDQEVFFIDYRYPSGIPYYEYGIWIELRTSRFLRDRFQLPYYYSDLDRVFFAGGSYTLNKEIFEAKEVLSLTQIRWIVYGSMALVIVVIVLLIVLKRKAQNHKQEFRNDMESGPFI